MTADLHTRIRDEIARRRALAEAVPGSWRAFGSWLAVFVDQHTCAGGTLESSYIHEPQCGYEPLMDVRSADLATFIAANGPDVELRRLDAAERVLELHLPTMETVQWWDDQTGDGHGYTCPTCRPDPGTVNREDLGYGNWGVKPDGWVDSYVVSPCPTLIATAAGLGIDIEETS